MVLVSEEVRSKLRKPLGKLYRRFPPLLHECRVIAIGDVVTLRMIWQGITPHLAVFDYRSMRKPVSGADEKTLRSRFKKPRRYRNRAGTVSGRILKDAGRLISGGGAVRIEGEEDLTALAFILKADENDAVVYGQPGKGIVVVRPNKKLKKKIRGWLASSAALGH